MSAAWPNRQVQLEVPTGLPLKIYLKIVRRGQGRNAGEAVTPQSLIVDLHKPGGPI